MSEKIFSIHKKLTEEYRRYFKKSGVIGYYKNPSRFKSKTYYLYLENGEKIVLGNSLEAVKKRLQDIYYADQLELDFLKPAAVAPQKQRKVKITPKRQELLEQVSNIKKWGRGVIAKIAANLGRTIGAVRSMLSVLTKKGLLVRIKRGQYSVAVQS